MSSATPVDDVTVPTTYVWSDDDVAIGRRAAEGCAEHVAGDYRFVELAGVSHWVPEQAPEQLAVGTPDRIASTRRSQPLSCRRPRPPRRPFAPSSGGNRSGERRW